MVQDNLTRRAPYCTTQPTMIGVDITNTIHLSSLQSRERRLTGAVLHDTISMCMSLVFCSKAAPTLWGRYTAFMGRTTQAAVRQEVLRLQFYVDDPIFALGRSRSERVEDMSIALL